VALIPWLRWVLELLKLLILMVRPCCLILSGQFSRAAGFGDCRASSVATRTFAKRESDIAGVTPQILHTGTLGPTQRRWKLPSIRKGWGIDAFWSFFRIHDSTTPNRQGDDIGPRYRSAVFYATGHQRRVAMATIATIDASGLWPALLVTEVLPASAFWPAEPEHRDYLDRHPGRYRSQFIRPGWILPARLRGLAIDEAEPGLE
jgi:hypothetical protein